MRHPTNFIITLLSLIIILASCGTKQPNVKLPAFELTYISGCVAIKKSKIRIYYHDNKYFADHILPIHFDGNNIDSKWTVELNEEQINNCITFLKTAKKPPSKLERVSSSENHYIIVIGKDTLDLNGRREGNDLDFQLFDQQLFKSKHLEIEKKRKQFIKELEKKLLGKWYLQPLKTNPIKRDDLLTFSRNKTSNNYLEFGNNDSIKGNCQSLFKMKDLKRYKTEISDGWQETVLSIYWGKQIYKGTVQAYDIMFDKNATFTLETITSDTLKLKYLW